ncbi:MAG TPA: hypothetical protein H9948_11790 [Candidatus Jeotgalibaca merdavium]|uniref:Uncharacterized protein n=1 Tax=Candidatus Jeotgalibaca merdavium TaxID=2838627 RepID=A0A9D2I3A0_9LACT|nr:hypothetical protein [Candidatus Jeotgalibaca merdavium]
MDNLYIKFIKKLEEQTDNLLLNWETVFRITHMYDVDYFNYLLYTNEFHNIDELKSYGLLNDKGLSIFLLNEDFESGKDGIKTKEKNLYIIEGLKGDTYKIPVKENELTQLENKIATYINRKEIKSSPLDGLIQKYLESD